jgi:small nuclear ribonucleoprotein (snRNP)-like protein
MSNSNSNPKKESILELAKMMDAVVRVKCLGGRELQGTLKGYDELVNLVLDDCDEFLRGTSCLLHCNIWCLFHSIDCTMFYLNGMAHSGGWQFSDAVGFWRFSLTSWYSILT